MRSKLVLILVFFLSLLLSLSLINPELLTLVLPVPAGELWQQASPNQLFPQPADDYYLVFYRRIKSYGDLFTSGFYNASSFLKAQLPVMQAFSPSSSSEQKLPSLSLEEWHQNGEPLIRIRESKESKVPVREKDTEGALIEPGLVLIHSHTAETYIDDPDDIGTGHVAPGEGGRITDVGEKIARILQDEYGESVLHDTTAHDREYSRSYLESRKTLQSILEQYPQPGIIIDLHRDALSVSSLQLTRTRIEDQKAARVLLIVSGDQLGLNHSEWRRNLAFAQYLGQRIEAEYPGLLRGVEVREGRIYNQDLHPRSIIMEIGDYRSHTREALVTARIIASVLASVLEDLRTGNPSFSLIS